MADSFLKWWTSIETDVRKSILVHAHRDSDRLHALIRMAFERGQESATPPSPSTAEDEMPPLPDLGHSPYDGKPLRDLLRAYGQECARAAFARGYDDGHIAGREKGMVAGRRAALSANAADREAKESGESSGGRET